jgi:riboflavin synthase
MFTGLVEETGSVLKLIPGTDVTTLEIRAPRISPSLSRGQSVSVMGACLTVVDLGRGTFTAEIMEETLKKTKMGKLKPGDPVNLERALALGDRLDGHLVTGHIDGLCFLETVEGRGRTRCMTFTAESGLVTMIVPKGSVALDGVSLTVIDSEPAGGHFSVGLIPETLRQTTLGTLAEKDAVNLETDIIAKYVRRFLSPREGAGREMASAEGITWETLQQGGWV